MAIKENNFTLDLTREGKYPVVKFRLNDNKVQKITFRLTNNGQEVDLEREMGDQFKPVFECIFRDKTFKRDEDRGNWEIKRDAKGKYPLYTFTYYLTDEVINKSGIACYYFALETPEGLRISTPTLKMVIDCDFKEDGKPSDNYVSEFEKLLKEANRVKQTIEDLDEILKEVIAGGASITEVIEAREDKSGNIFPKLKDRLDNIETISWGTDKEVKNARVDSDNVVHGNLNDRLTKEEWKRKEVLKEIQDARITYNGNKKEWLYERLNEDVRDIYKQLKKNDKDIGVTEHIAHRGFSWVAPENTLIACQMAVSHGFDSLECDVQCSSDGTPVVIHDDTLERTTNGTGKVHERDISYLKTLDASKTRPYYAGAKIPTLEEWCRFAHGNSKRIYPEIKGYRNDADIKTMVDIVNNTGWEEKCVYQSFYPYALEQVRKHTRISGIGHLVGNYDDYLNRLELLKDDPNGYMLPDYKILLKNPELVKKTYDMGIDIGVWTTDNGANMQALKNIGVTKFMSNRIVGVL